MKTINSKYFLQDNSKCKNSKGQISMEFMISVIIVLAVFVVGMGIMQDRFNYNLAFSRKSSAEIIAFDFSRNINSVYLLDDNACLTDTIFWNDDSDKNVFFVNNSIEVHYSGGFVGTNVLTKNVSWNISDINGLIYFHKTNGYVVVDYNGDSC